MNARIIRFHIPRSRRDDAQIQDEFDDLVTRACDGDRHALAAIALAFSTSLLKEARAELGRFKHDADDVLQDFFIAVMEGGARFDRDEEHAHAWMNRIVREIARTHRADRERDWEV
jgi:DNA-directed RNA polymerase specialized sigma24 family protein